MNNARQKKLMWVVLMLIGTAIAVGLILYAMRQQTDYYFDPTAISAGKAPEINVSEQGAWWWQARSSETHLTL